MCWLYANVTSIYSPSFFLSLKKLVSIQTLTIPKFSLYQRSFFLNEGRS